MTENTVDNNENLFDPLASKAERYDKGTAIRKDVPRSSHQEWSAPEDREDPIAILIKPALVELKIYCPFDIEE